jgi:hypothetical protein
MNLSEQTQGEIIRHFPNIAPSYQNIPNKKVPSLFFAIPMGKKVFMWFTYLHEKPVCLSLVVTSHNTISSISCKLASFDEILCLGTGTILYGTLFTSNNLNIFTAEDLYSYKGRHVVKRNFQYRFNLLNTILDTEIQQTIYFKEQVIFSIPIFHNNYDPIIRQIENSCPYRVFNILQKGLIESFYRYTSYKTTERFNLLVTADNQNDIYNLHDKHDEFIGIASINNYKTSVMMNKLFRNIKENTRLDTLEESDDEEEFENVSSDKYLLEDKRLNMECQYHRRFKKWQPIRLAKNPVTVSKRYICEIEKKYN